MYGGSERDGGREGDVVGNEDKETDNSPLAATPSFGILSLTGWLGTPDKRR